MTSPNVHQCSPSNRQGHIRITRIIRPLPTSSHIFPPFSHHFPPFPIHEVGSGHRGRGIRGFRNSGALAWRVDRAKDAQTVENFQNANRKPCHLQKTSLIEFSEVGHWHEHLWVISRWYLMIYIDHYWSMFLSRSFIFEYFEFDACICLISSCLLPLPAPTAVNPSSIICVCCSGVVPTLRCIQNPFWQR